MNFTFSGERIISITQTSEELSIVLPAEQVQAGWIHEDGWRAIKVRGPLEFGLTGVLSSLLLPLAENNISIFSISTYNTDYILVRQEKLDHAVVVLRNAGFLVERE